MLIFDVLKKDHDEVKQLMEELSKGKPGRVRGTKFEKMKKELESHIKLEEKLFYKKFLDEPKLRGMILEGYEEHALVKKMLRDMSRESDSDKWMAKLKVARELVEHHVEEEEKEMFKLARKLMDRSSMEELGSDYEKAHEKMVA